MHLAATLALLLAAPASAAPNDAPISDDEVQQLLNSLDPDYVPPEPTPPPPAPSSVDCFRALAHTGPASQHGSQCSEDNEAPPIHGQVVVPTLSMVPGSRQIADLQTFSCYEDSAWTLLDCKHEEVVAACHIYAAQTSPCALVQALQKPGDDGTGVHVEKTKDSVTTTTVSRADKRR